MIIRLWFYPLCDYSLIAFYRSIEQEVLIWSNVYGFTRDAILANRILQINWTRGFDMIIRLWFYPQCHNSLIAYYRSIEQEVLRMIIRLWFYPLCDYSLIEYYRSIDKRFRYDHTFMVLPAMRLLANRILQINWTRGFVWSYVYGFTRYAITR